MQVRDVSENATLWRRGRAGRVRARSRQSWVDASGWLSGAMKGQLDGLVAQALRVGGVIEEMNAMVKKGEESGKSLNSFIEEVRVKLEKS